MLAMSVIRKPGASSFDSTVLNENKAQSVPF